MSFIPTRMRKQRGQSLVEGTFVLLIFFMLLFAIIDCAQVLVAHQALVERVRTAVRWGSVHPTSVTGDGSGEPIANLILYDNPDEPRQSAEGYLGLTRANIQVRYRPPVPDRPDDEMVTVAIVNYSYRFLSPWFTKALVNPRPVAISAPLAYRSSALAARSDELSR